MTIQPESADKNGKNEHGPTYYLDFEGDVREWHEATVTLSQLRELAGWPADQQVVLVDLATNVETTVGEDEPIELKPGHGFARRFKFKRGDR